MDDIPKLEKQAVLSRGQTDHISGTHDLDLHFSALHGHMKKVKGQSVQKNIQTDAQTDEGDCIT